MGAYAKMCLSGTCTVHTGHDSATALGNYIQWFGCYHGLVCTVSWFVMVLFNAAWFGLTAWFAVCWVPGWERTVGRRVISVGVTAAATR